MTHKTELTSEILYTDPQLIILFDALDELHTAVGEDRWQDLTTLNRRELITLLVELIYVAQETVSELDAQQEPPVKLRVLEKP
jgi:hypothetical protein